MASSAHITLKLDPQDYAIVKAALEHYNEHLRGEWNDERNYAEKAVISSRRGLVSQLHKSI